jgi:hypothetical protein
MGGQKHEKEEIYNKFYSNVYLNTRVSIQSGV